MFSDCSKVYENDNGDGKKCLELSVEKEKEAFNGQDAVDSQ